MSMKRINHPSEVVSVSDIVKVYVYDVDETKERVQLSLLPLEELARRDEMKKERSLKKAHNRPYHKEKQEKPVEKEISEEEAMKRLLERFGSKY